MDRPAGRRQAGAMNTVPAAGVIDPGPELSRGTRARDRMAAAGAWP
jgi:hypothetical protein